MANMGPILLLLVIMVTRSEGQLVPCSTATLSFAVTVDGSASVDASQFQQQKDFIKRLITRIDVSGNSNAGLVQFASSSQIHIRCNDAATSRAFNTLVDGVNLMTGATCIKCGLEKAQELLSGNGCGRAGENKIIFLMVDGDENIFPNQVVTTASNLRNAGYVIYALAIGNIVDTTKIALLTGSSDRVFRTQFADLATYDIETLYAALTSTYCTVSQTGILTQWSSYGACSATCQSGLQAPTQQRTRSCVGATFGGNCNGALLVQHADCNVEVACPGSLTQWFQWGACSENCHSNPNVTPTRSRTRQCLGATFGGNCGGASLTMTATCNVEIGCQGQWSNWSAYGGCIATCQSNVNTAPTQSRTRTCNGGTFGTTCPGNGVDTRDCSVGVACPGSLTQWSGYGVCSATCQSGVQAPTQQRTRSCVGATFGGNCNGALLVQNTDCNVEVACPGILFQWSAYGACSANCRFCFADPPPTQQRRRVCVGATFGGNCKGALLVETIDCNVDVACQALSLLPWAQWGACSENCQSNPNVSPTRTRTRQCGSFGASCSFTSACFTITGACNVGVGCQGSLSQWSAYGACSATCQSGLTVPTRQRTRNYVGATFGGNCNGSVLVQNLDCNVPMCQASCFVQKRCNCSLAPQFPTTAPALGYFNIDDATIHAAINTLAYWTKEIRNQICESCNLQRLQVSVNTVTSHVNQLKTMIDRLNEIKKRLRDIINCNNNVSIGSELWALYDYLYARCTMLNGVYIELSAWKIKFEAANNACKKYGWFHQLIEQVYKK